MNSLLNLILRLYDRLLSLYPTGYRQEFDGEMRYVFYQGAAEADAKGWRRLIVYGWRELRDSPGCLFSAHLASFQVGRELQPTQVELVGEGFPPFSSRTPSSWQDSLLAGLPHLLVTLGLSLTWLTWRLGNKPATLQTDSGTFLFFTDILLAAVMLVLFGAAWRKGWPRWSASLTIQVGPARGLGVGFFSFGLPGCVAVPGRCGDYLAGFTATECNRRQKGAGEAMDSCQAAGRAAARVYHAAHSFRIQPAGAWLAVWFGAG
jgi:hypothetical protein